MPEELGPELIIPTSGFKSLAKVAEHGDRIEEIVRRATELSASECLRGVCETIAGESGITQSAVRDILEGVSTLQYLRSRMDIDAKRFLELLTHSIEHQAPKAWTDKNLANWKSCRKNVGEVVGSAEAQEALKLFQKARELELAHQNILTESRLITDIRPVFNRVGDKIVEAVLSHVLILEFQEAGRRRRLELTLDADDIAQLRQACERTEVKTATINDSVKELSWQLTSPGEGAD